MCCFYWSSLIESRCCSLTQIAHISNRKSNVFTNQWSQVQRPFFFLCLFPLLTPCPFWFPSSRKCIYHTAQCFHLRHTLITHTTTTILFCFRCECFVRKLSEEQKRSPINEFNSCSSNAAVVQNQQIEHRKKNEKRALAIESKSNLKVKNMVTILRLSASG